jgi:ribonuclease BN (tRNA processing enzyme)
MVEIVFVGTGDAFGSGGRRNSAILVRARGQTLLLDCGPTTLLGLKHMGIDPREIDAIALSHFHGDHASGVPFVLLDYLYENKRERPLDIIGPEGTRERVEHMTCVFGYETELERPYDLRYREFAAGQTLETAGFQLKPLPAFHHPETKPHMLRIESDDGAILFSGDTGWTEQLPEQAGDASLFICECTMIEEGFEYHLSYERLSRERSRFDCDRIMLTHLGSEVLGDLDRVEFETATDGLRLKL